MSIESKIPAGEIGIKDLSLEQPETTVDLVFDPERDISPANQQRIFKELQRLKPVGASGSMLAYADIVTNARFVLPEEFEKRRVGQEALSALRTGFHFADSQARFNLNDFQTWSGLVRLARNFKLLYPEKVGELNLIPMTFNEMNHEIKNHSGDLEERISYWADLAVLFPDRITDMEITTEVWDKLERDIKWCKENNKFGESLANAQFKAKILFPKKAASLSLDSSDWKLMKSTLNEQSEKDFMGSYAHLAMQMKLLAMDNLRVTDKGFEYSLPAKLNAHRPGLPETKKF